MTADHPLSRPPTLDDEGISLELADPGAVRTFFDQARGQEGFLLPLPESPKLYEVLPVRVSVADSFEMTVQARVIQAFERRGELQVAFQLEGWNAGRDAQLTRLLGEAERAAKGGGETAGAGGGGADTTSAIVRIKGMNVSQRMRLAMKAGRQERAVLLRDSSPQVLMGLLSNPRLESEDVLQIVRSTNASGGLLKRVAGDRRWMQNAEIRTAVVRNPKTPMPLALRLLEGLRTSDLQVMSKAGQTREALRRAAVKIYLKRISKR